MTSLLGLIERAIQRRGRDATRLGGGHLVLHERDERRNDDGEAAEDQAGTWKQIDLPPPVGSTASVSLPSRTDWMTGDLRGPEFGIPEMVLKQSSGFGHGVGHGRKSRSNPDRVAGDARTAREAQPGSVSRRDT